MNSTCSLTQKEQQAGRREAAEQRRTKGEPFVLWNGTVTSVRQSRNVAQKLDSNAAGIKYGTNGSNVSLSASINNGGNGRFTQHRKNLQEAQIQEDSGASLNKKMRMQQGPIIAESASPSMPTELQTMRNACRQGIGNASASSPYMRNFDLQGALYTSPNDNGRNMPIVLQQNVMPPKRMTIYLAPSQFTPINVGKNGSTAAGLSSQIPILHDPKMNMLKILKPRCTNNGIPNGMTSAQKDKLIKIERELIDIKRRVEDVAQSISSLLQTTGRSKFN
uniref:Uncharacterized protein n=1 Tax=Trichuris muris TaxID=70415 RepID=A0A5S6PZU6_TRIMR